MNTFLGEILHFLALKQLECTFTGSEVILLLYRLCSVGIHCIYVGSPGLWRRVIRWKFTDILEGQRVRLTRSTQEARRNIWEDGEVISFLNGLSSVALLKKMIRIFCELFAAGNEEIVIYFRTAFRQDSVREKPTATSSELAWSELKRKRPKAFRLRCNCGGPWPNPAYVRHIRHSYTIWSGESSVCIQTSTRDW
jgi:hypothetical protein